MKKHALNYLCCPACRATDLQLSVFKETGEHVMDGALRCGGCRRVYLVVRGIPRMLPANLFHDEAFASEHRDALAALGWRPPEGFIAEHVELKEDTSKVYGYEWTHWDRHGWEEGGGPRDYEVDTFHYKSLLSPAELKGKVVVDAGCGNGRYAHTAARHAKEVIALDLSQAVESAFKNLGDLPAHVVQGDILNPPIRPVVDAVYSIGVLMITGDCRRATATLAGLLKPGGTITVHVYAAGWPVWQACDAAVRAVTTRLSIPANRRLAQTFTRISQFFIRHRLQRYTDLVIRFMPDDARNFDWYATPKQTYHTYPEVKGWFRDMGYELVATNEPQLTDKDRTLPWRVAHFIWRPWMLTVRARKPAAASAARPAA